MADTLADLAAGLDVGRRANGEVRGGDFRYPFGDHVVFHRRPQAAPLVVMRIVARRMDAGARDVTGRGLHPSTLRPPLL